MQVNASKWLEVRVRFHVGVFVKMTPDAELICLFVLFFCLFDCVLCPVNRRHPHLLSLAKDVKLGKYTVPIGNRTPGRRVAVHYATAAPRKLHEFIWSNPIVNKWGCHYGFQCEKPPGLFPQFLKPLMIQADNMRQLPGKWALTMYILGLFQCLSSKCFRIVLVEMMLDIQ